MGYKGLYDCTLQYFSLDITLNLLRKNNRKLPVLIIIHNIYSGYTQWLKRVALYTTLQLFLFTISHSFLQLS